MLEFKDINLTTIKFEKTSIVDPKIENIIFNDLECDKNKPMRIQITNSFSFKDSLMNFNVKQKVLAVLN